MKFTFRKAVTLNILYPHKNCEYLVHITSIHNFLANIFHHNRKHFLRSLGPWEFVMFSTCFFQHIIFLLNLFYWVLYPHLIFGMTGMLQPQNCIRADDAILNDFPDVTFFRVHTFHVFWKSFHFKLFI